MSGFLIKLIGKYTVRRELSVTIMLAVILLVVFISVVSSWQVSGQIRADLLEQGKRVTENFAQQSVLALLYQSPENIAVAAEATLAYPNVIGLQVCNLDQSVLLQDGAPIAQPLFSAQQLAGYSGGAGAMVVENDDAWLFSAPVYTQPSSDGLSPRDYQEMSPELVGSVSVVLSKQSLVKTNEEIFTSNLVTSIAFAGVFLLLIRFFVRCITDPLDELEEKMGLAQAGESGVRVNLTGPKDLVKMAGAFNQMMAEIEARDADLCIVAVAFESDEGMLVTDVEGRVIRINEAFTDLTGYESTDILGEFPLIFKSDVQEEAFYLDAWESVQSKGSWQGELWTQHKNGESRLVLLTISRIVNADNALTNYFAAFVDMTARNRAENEIHNLAFYDQLSKLPNRRLLFDRLQQVVARGSISNSHCALLFLDLDHFKILNDTKGHVLGDMLLVEVAKRLQSAIRDSDIVARFGGDEFVVLLEGLAEIDEQAAEQAQIVAEKLLKLTNQSYNLDGHVHHGSSSIGVTVFVGHQNDPNDLLKQADMAMYVAKKSGRNTLRFFDSSMQHEVETRAQLEVDLHRALLREEFQLYYQAQVNHEGKVVGAEVLLRWHHPELGLLFPREFIALAEDTDFIIPLGKWVLETACQQLIEWAGDPLTSHLDIAVNVSVLQFRQKDFVEHVQGLLQRYGIKPLRLKIELTETVMLDDVSGTIKKMDELRKFGVRFSMDDFGTGYSSLAYLTKLPLDQLKIDQSFIRNIEERDSDAVIVQTIIAMAKTLEIEVIAEGVETQRHRDILAQAGCFLCQGYLFGRPAPIEEFSKIIQNKMFKGDAEDVRQV
jgi:diguanylate cyclase (GGDEF)-like protein/PAS domain S-box-containing protein